MTTKQIMVESAQQIDTGGRLNTEGEDHVETMATAELGEAELEILCKYLQETVASLLAVNKDLLNHELHAPEKLELLKQFAQDKSQRSLVIAKIEKPSTNASVDGADTTASNKDASATSDTMSLSSMRDSNIQIYFSTKIEYLGPTAQTIAFLKREDFAKLDLASGMDLDKVLETGLTSQDSQAAPTGDHSDLSSQIQVVNLGYLGQDSNIFELASTYFDFSFMPLFTDYKNKTQVSASGGDQSQGA